MRWGTLAAALVVVLVAQKALVWTWAFDAGAPLIINLFLSLSILLALGAPAPDARIACWICGFVQDLAGAPESIGIHSFCLGITGLLLVGFRESRAAGAFAPRWAGAFAAAWIGQFVYLLHLNAWLAKGTDTAWTLLIGSASIALWSTLVALACTALPFLVWRRRSLRPSRRW